jgi:hypothetical protein
MTVQRRMLSLIPTWLLHLLSPKSTYRLKAARWLVGFSYSLASLPRTREPGHSWPGLPHATATCLVCCFVSTWTKGDGDWLPSCAYGEQLFTQTHASTALARARPAGNARFSRTGRAWMGGPCCTAGAGQARRLVWATNHLQLSPGEPGSPRNRQPITP